MKKIMVMLMVVSSIGWTIPSMSGTNGLVHMPVATSVKYKEYDFGVNFQTSQADKIGHYFASLGIFDGVELGFIGRTNREGVFINLKYYMLSDKSEYPLGLAAGVTGLTSYTNTDLYMVLSKAFPNKLAGHFGFKTNVNAATIRADVMFGLEMNLSEQMNVVADVMGSDTTWNLSTGLRLKLTQDLTLNGYLEDILNSDDAKFTLGISSHGML